MTTGQIFGYLLATFIGSFLFYEGFKRLFILYRLQRKGRYTNGTVVRREKGDAYNTTVPFVSFIDNEGNVIEGTARNSIPSKGVYLRSPGDTVKIYFDPSNPHCFVIDAISDKITSLIAMLFGCIFLYAVIFSLYKQIF